VNPELQPEVEAAFATALELPTTERLAFLDRKYRDRPDVRTEVESLLRAYRAAGAFLEPGAPAPVSIGPYRIVAQIGAGGMGNVYRAERDDAQFRQQVAIKMIGAGLERRPEFIRRFIDERQILAGLAHPNIARLLDGGYSDRGAPYLVMEYVDGVPLTGYCARHNLALDARLRLFLDLCSAVQFAHQHLVIHRDLKPANVLVTAEGTPKLLDFGIARLAGHDSGRTLTLAQAATLDYASPEQVRAAAVSTASDIYSLGVMLYELVAGRQPYHLADASLEHAIEQICRHDPAPPGAAASHVVPEDLDAIVLKAMRKEPNERYAAVKELTDDIERYFSSEPVLARRGTVRYRAAKFVRRNRAGVAVGVAVALVLGAAVASVVWQARIARQERDRAEHRFNDLRGFARTIVFDMHQKLVTLPGTTPVRKELVATALAYLDTLAKEAESDVGLHKELAQGYMRIGDVQGNPNEHNLGDTAGMLQSYAKAEAIARRMAAVSASRESRGLLSEVLRDQVDGYRAANNLAKASASAEESLAIARQIAEADPGGEEARRSLALSLAAVAKVNQNPKSSAYRQESAGLFDGLLAAKPSDAGLQRSTAIMHKYVAAEMVAKNDLDGALPHLQRAEELDALRVRDRPDDPVAKMDLAIDWSQWGGYYELRKDMPKAIEFTRKTLALRRELAAADPQNKRLQDRLAYILTQLGLMQSRQAPREAMANAREALAICRNIQTESIRVEYEARSYQILGAAAETLGRRQESCAAYGESVKRYAEGAKLSPTMKADADDAAQEYARRCPGKAK
jgi:non-specific serine/threonine protein kinase/serine/threonine-protein kinase